MLTINHHLRRARAANSQPAALVLRSTSDRARRVGFFGATWATLCRDDRRIVTRIQSGWRSIDDMLAAVTGPRRRLGELLLSAGRISKTQLDAVLVEQRQRGERIGALMVARGLVSAPEVAMLVRAQDRLGLERASSAEPVRLGNLLVARGDLSPVELDDAIRRQRRSSRRIGEVLVEEGYATKVQVDRGLALQAAITAAALAGILTLAVTPNEMHAASALESNDRAPRAHVDFAIRIPPFLRLTRLTQPRMLSIDDDDIARGFVDVPAGTHIEIATNRRDGFFVVFQGRFDIVKKVRIRDSGGMSHAVELDEKSAVATVRMPLTMPDTRLDVAYRFDLAPDARPGNYLWPVSISAGAGT